MIQDISPLVFDNSYHDLVPRPEDTVFVFTGTSRKEDVLYARNTSDGTLAFPKAEDLTEEQCKNLRYLFQIGEERFFLFDSNGENSFIPSDCHAERVRLLANLEPMHLAFAESTAYHLFCWYRNNRYCGKCGSSLAHSAEARELRCSHCGNIIYPRIDPAVIIGLIDGDRLLVSHYAGRIYKGTALLAGFCEVGESPEETVARETMEEVGIRVKNITYFGSQPWGIDSNLLCGYFCEADGETDIRLDPDELSSAQFISRQQLPPMPNTISLTATMIEAFRDGYSISK